MTMPAPRFLGRLCRLRSDRRGSMAVETAIVAPVLVMMALGSFDVSRMVARQHELQSGISETEAIALAANMGAETDTSELKDIIKDSLDLTDNQVSVTKIYRCNDSSTLSKTNEECDHDNDVVSTYVRVQLTDSYAPIWTHLGIGGNFSYSLTRTVQLS